MDNRRSRRSKSTSSERSRDELKTQTEQRVEAMRERAEALREQVDRLRNQLADSPPSPKALILSSLAAGLLLGFIIAYAVFATHLAYERDAAVVEEKIRIQSYIDAQNERIHELEALLEPTAPSVNEL